MREDVFRVISGERNKTYSSESCWSSIGLVLGAVVDFKDDVDGPDPGSNDGKLGGGLVRTVVVRHRVALRWASCYLPCEGFAASLVEGWC